jgi:uncharacterized membrane protein YgcG
MNYKQNFILWILCIVFFANCGETINSHWKDRTIKVDGNSEDWQGVPLHYDEDQKVMYGIINDDSTLNVMIRFNETGLARMFSMRGMILWLNDENEEEKKIGFHYKERFTREQRNGIMDRKRFNGNGNQNAEIPTSIPPQGSFLLAINYSIIEKSIEKIDGLAAATGYENGLYCYEFGIPLVSTDNLPYVLNVSAKKEIKIGMEILAISAEERAKMKEKMAERGSGGMRGGGMKGGGGRRGGGMRGGGGMQAMPDMDGEEFWMTVHLAI